MNPKILVSILSYNKAEDTIETIECFRNQSCMNYDLIIIDNASSGDCVAKLRDKYPEMKMICLKENIGYVGGNNLALEIGLKEDYDFVVISNDDIAIEPDILENMIETAQSNPSAGVIGVVEENYYSGETKAIGGHGFNFIRAKGKWLTKRPCERSSVIEVDYVQGALLLFTKKAIRSNILFDANLFMYCDEIDIYFQLQKNGQKAFVDTRCRVRHKSVNESFNLLQGYFIQRNRLYLSRKYAPFYIYICTIIYTLLLELPVKIFIRSIQGYPYYAWSCVLGYWDGLRGNMSIGRGLDFKRFKDQDGKKS